MRNSISKSTSWQCCLLKSSCTLTCTSQQRFRLVSFKWQRISFLILLDHWTNTIVYWLYSPWVMNYFRVGVNEGTCWIPIIYSSVYNRLITEPAPLLPDFSRASKPRSISPQNALPSLPLPPQENQLGITQRPASLCQRRFPHLSCHEPHPLQDRDVSTHQVDPLLSHVTYLIWSYRLRPLPLPHQRQHLRAWAPHTQEHAQHNRHCESTLTPVMSLQYSTSKILCHSVLMFLQHLLLLLMRFSNCCC